MTRKPLAVGVLFLVAVGAAWAYAQEQKAPRAQPATAGFDRASPRSIRSAADEILADPRYRPHKTFAQWFLEQMRDWQTPALDRSSGWVGVLFWLFIVWCVITLVASLVHIAWTLVPLLRPRQGADRRPRGPAGLHEHLLLPYETLLGMARHAAESGDHRGALHWMMLALLRWLADRRLISLHPSKTNGDYVREFSRAAEGAGALMADFASDFDRFAYGGADCGRGDFARMNDSFKRVQTHAGPQA
jgi:hypothetical protein